MNSVDKYLNLPYSYIVKKEDDGTYLIRVKELQGCMSVGDSTEEAFMMIKDAMREWIQYHIDLNIPIPYPEEESVKTYSGKFVVRLTPALHRDLALAAKEHGVCLNLLVAESP